MVFTKAFAAEIAAVQKTALLFILRMKVRLYPNPYVFCCLAWQMQSNQILEL